MRSVVLVAALVGCGDGLTVAGDAATETPDAPGGLVEVQLVGDGSLSGHRVYFQQWDSQLALATVTNDEGRASAFMRPGGFVTVVVERVGGVDLYTHVDVQPGEQLFVGGDVIEDRNRPEWLTPVVKTLAPEAASYRLFAPGQNAALLSPSSDPAGEWVIVQNTAAQVDLLLVADLEDGTSPRYQYREDANLEYTVSLTGTYAPFQRSTVTVEGRAPEASEYGVQQALVDPSGELGRRYSATVFDDRDVVSVELMPLPPSATLMTIYEPFTNSDHIVDWRPASTSTRLDLEGRSLRAIHAPAYAAHEIRWSDGSGSDLGDVVLANLQWATFEVAANWYLLGPRTDEPHLRVPVLPRAELVPPDFVTTPNDVIVIDAATDTARTVLGRWRRGQMWPYAGEAGQVRWRPASP